VGRGKDAHHLPRSKVASDVLAIIIKEPVYARFLRAHAHLTKDEWEALAKFPYPLRLIWGKGYTNQVVADGRKSFAPTGAKSVEYCRYTWHKNCSLQSHISWKVRFPRCA
jgi:hypothetical protein